MREVKNYREDIGDAVSDILSDLMIGNLDTLDDALESIHDYVDSWVMWTGYNFELYRALNLDDRGDELGAEGIEDRVTASVYLHISDELHQEVYEWGTELIEVREALEEFLSEYEGQPFSALADALAEGLNGWSRVGLGEYHHEDGHLSVRLSLFEAGAEVTATWEAFIRTETITFNTEEVAA